MTERDYDANCPLRTYESPYCCEPDMCALTKRTCYGHWPCHLPMPLCGSGCPGWQPGTAVCLPVCRILSTALLNIEEGDPCIDPDATRAAVLRWLATGDVREKREQKP